MATGGWGGNDDGDQEGDKLWNRNIMSAKSRKYN